MEAVKHLVYTAQALAGIDFSVVDKIIELLKDAKKDDRLVFTFGNGGSHSTASHFAADLLKACNVRAVCISDMIPTILAYMNDEGPSEVFTKPLSVFGDIKNANLIGFSCSGNSQNIIRAFMTPTDAFISRAERVLFTGDIGGKAIKLADVVLSVPNENIRIQESVHLAICHAIVEELING